MTYLRESMNDHASSINDCFFPVFLSGKSSRPRRCRPASPRCIWQQWEASLHIIVQTYNATTVTSDFCRACWKNRKTFYNFSGGVVIVSPGSSQIWRLIVSRSLRLVSCPGIDFTINKFNETIYLLLWFYMINT